MRFAPRQQGQLGRYGTVPMYVGVFVLYVVDRSAHLLRHSAKKKVLYRLSLAKTFVAG